jgi:16S rRNA (cytidine1402-2'-O)-methyltransferase
MTLPAFSFSGALPMMQDLVAQNYPARALYVLATPIGNAADISLRALQVLALADAVACEDTRNTAHLLTRYGLQRPLIAAHQHNEREVADKLIARLQAGERIALVSDAGTPAVSDPGARIVDAVRAAGLRVVPVPGASAVIAALSAAGLVNDRFHFHGFLPAKARQRDTALAQLKPLAATLVFYEAPHRIVDTVAALATLFEPTRQLVLARELTKLFEEIHRCPLADAAAWLAADANRQRGEFVLVLHALPEAAGAAEVLPEAAERLLEALLEARPLKQAVALAAEAGVAPRNLLYRRALELRDAVPEEPSDAAGPAGAQESAG